MQNTMTKILLALMFMLSFSMAWAQEQEEDLSPYFDDGGLSIRGNLIRTDVVRDFLGLPNLEYERIFLKQFAIHIGAYKILNKTVIGPQIPLFDGVLLDRKGFGVQGGVNLYPISTGRRAPEGINVGLTGEYVSSSDSSESTQRYKSVILSQGGNYFLTDLLALGYSAGIGYRSMATSQEQYIGGPITTTLDRFFVYRFSVSLGIHF